MLGPYLDPLQTPETTDATLEATWRATIKRRLSVVLAFLALWIVGIEARLVQLQVFQHNYYVTEARGQQERGVKLFAKRGDIIDRQGRLLAYSVDAAAVASDPTAIENPTSTVFAICSALGDCTAKERADLVNRLSGSGAFKWVRRSRLVSPDQARQVADLALPGVMLMSEERRYYPKRELAAHLLGFVGVDNRGQGGVEFAFDEAIRGREGLVLVQRDARLQRVQSRVEQTPTAGATLELTIDLHLQHIAERELRAGIEEHHARGGTAIIMDPHTGEILAQASYPTFNPNAIDQAPADNRRNRAIQEIYEPGSTFKIVTASAAIEERVLSPSDYIDCSPGYITFPGRKPIYDVHRYGALTFEDVIVKSSNVGAIRAGLRIGAERLARYIRRFGFGEALSPDFRGQAQGIVWKPEDLDDSALASVSMGYQIGVTPIQMATAVSAIANGGLVYEPHAVRALIRDGVRTPIEPKQLRRAIAPETAAVLTSIMEGVVERGTAKAAALARYQVAGKTGTAAKVVNGRYSDSEYNASFVGFVPSRKPAFTILVVIDTPQKGQTYGGLVAAPIFRRIAEAALQQIGVAPTINPTPPVIITESSRRAAEPAPATAILPAVAQVGGPSSMPDVRGLGARAAVRVLRDMGLFVRLHGSGIVTAQTPEPGSQVETGGWSVLQLRRSATDARAPGGHQ